MRPIMRPIIIMLTASALAACQPAANPPELAAPAIAASKPESEQERHARALAQAACGGCHGVEQFGLSANPKAPEFPTIVNRPGLTQASLRDWLVDAHNYPEEMDFYLEGDEVDELVSYMLTLQSDNYRLPPS